MPGKRTKVPCSATRVRGAAVKCTRLAAALATECAAHAQTQAELARCRKDLAEARDVARQAVWAPSGMRQATREWPR